MHGIDNIVKKKKRTLNPDGNFKSKPFYQTSYEKKEGEKNKKKNETTSLISSRRNKSISTPCHTLKNQRSKKKFLEKNRKGIKKEREKKKKKQKIVEKREKKNYCMKLNLKVKVTFCIILLSVISLLQKERRKGGLEKNGKQ